MERKYGYGEGVIRFRWWIILATLLFVVAAASGARFLEFSSDYRVFFSKKNPQMQAFDALQNTYTKNDNVMIALAPKDGRRRRPRLVRRPRWPLKGAAPPLRGQCPLPHRAAPSRLSRVGPPTRSPVLN